MNTATVDQLTSEQIGILKHTAFRAAGGFFCGDSPEMKSLVAMGLMEFAGRKSFVPDRYFRLTVAGRSIVNTLAILTPGPRISKRKAAAKERYEAYLRAETGESFLRFLQRHFGKANA